MLPSEFRPAPNSFINNNRPTIRVKFAKSAYSSRPLENISVTSAKLIKSDGTEIDILPDIETISSGEVYNRELLVKYFPKQALSDGFYQVVVSANSNVGMAQALWPFTIDTVPPTVRLISN